MTDLADAVARAVLREAQVEARADAVGAADPADPASSALGAEEHLAVIAASAQAEQACADLLHRSVLAARSSGISWARIGGQLGMTRQAAQQRFGAQAGEQAEGAERWLGPVTAFDEMAELELAGRAGWHTVEVGMLTHRMVRTDTQWQHRRILWRSVARELADGWQIGCRAFPWVYLVRDTGIPVES